jgi:hypothetical protein
MENINQSVNEIKQQIKLLTDELVTLQTNCKHSNYNLKYYEESKSVLKVCGECEKVLGYPNKEELEENDFI